MKRYLEPMAHGPEACEPSHPLTPAVGESPCSLTREIWNPISNHQVDVELPRFHCLGRFAIRNR